MTHPTTMGEGLLSSMLSCNGMGVHLVPVKAIKKIKAPEGFDGHVTEMLTGQCDYCEERVFSWAESTTEPLARKVVPYGDHLWFSMPSFVVEEIPA